MVCRRQDTLMPPFLPLWNSRLYCPPPGAMTVATSNCSGIMVVRPGRWIRFHDNSCSSELQQISIDTHVYISPYGSSAYRYNQCSFCK